MYKVIVKFADLEDNNHVYEVGDTYPRADYMKPNESIEFTADKPSEERIQFLASDRNKLRTPVIELVEEEVAPKKRSSKKSTK